jgi:hypothetical protein
MRNYPFMVIVVFMLPLSGCLDSITGSDDVISDTVVINEDEYVGVTFECSSECDVEVNFEQNYGPLMDIYTMTPMNYQNFKSCDEFYYISELSDPGTRGFSGSATIEEGKYYIVFDNSDCGDTAPPWNGEDDSAGVFYEVKLN